VLLNAQERCHGGSVPCSILYQRGIYPPESFKQEKKYGLSLLMTSEPGLVKYINSILDHLKCMRHARTHRYAHVTVLLVCHTTGSQLFREPCRF
jgi:hypothetical protein